MNGNSEKACEIERCIERAVHYNVRARNVSKSNQRESWNSYEKLPAGAAKLQDGKMDVPRRASRGFTDTLLFRVPFARALSRRNRKSIRPRGQQTWFEVKLRKGGKQMDITTGQSNYCVYAGNVHFPADNFHLCQVSAQATFSRCSTLTICRINRNSPKAFRINVCCTFV